MYKYIVIKNHKSFKIINIDWQSLYDIILNLNTEALVKSLVENLNHLLEQVEVFIRNGPIIKASQKKVPSTSKKFMGFMTSFIISSH